MISVILLAGGSGKRMGNSVPKQFLQLDNKAVILHSFDVLIHLPEVAEVIVVCSPDHRPLFSCQHILLKFALPGEERQDSVRNGFQVIDPKSDWVCIHDGARPFVTQEITQRAIDAAKEHGAADFMGNSNASSDPNRLVG